MSKPAYQFRFGTDPFPKFVTVRFVIDALGTDNDSLNYFEKHGFLPRRKTQPNRKVGWSRYDIARGLCNLPALHDFEYL